MSLKSLILTFCLFASFQSPLMADETKKTENFAKAKSDALANLEKRISHLQETKSCVSSASDRKALKACRMEARKKGEAMRAEMKDKRMKMKEEKMKRKMERKSK